MNRRKVERSERPVDALPCIFRRNPLEQARVKTFFIFFRAFFFGKDLAGLQERQADPVSQLRGGRVGEGDDQDVFDLERSLYKQANIELLDRIGLARTRAGFDKLEAAELDFCRVKRSCQSDAPRWAFRGLNIFSARAWNELSRPCRSSFTR